MTNISTISKTKLFTLGPGNVTPVSTKLLTCDSQSTQHGNILIVTGNKVSKIEANTRGFYINITVKYIALPLATKYLSKQNHQIKPLSTQLTSVFHFY